MGFFSWLLGKGLAGAISKDLCVKYLRLRKKFPNEAIESTIIRVWNLWLTLNEDAIRRQDSEDKIVRLCQ